MDPIFLVLIVLFIIYIVKSLFAFFLTGMLASVTGIMKANMHKRKIKVKYADYLVLMTWLAFLLSAARIAIPIIVIVGLARGIQGYYLVSLVAFVIFTIIRGIGISFGPVCRNCGQFRVDPIELLIIFFSAMAYFA